MRKIILSFLFFSSLVFISCNEEPITGADDVTEISTFTFTVDTTYAFGNDFVAKGTVKNIGNKAITPVWYFEGSFFRDNGSFKMGGDNTSFNFSLGAGQSTGWELVFKSSQYSAVDYPHFRIADTRVFKNEISTEE